MKSKKDVPTSETPHTVAETKPAERAPRDSEVYFRSLVQRAADIILVLDSTGSTRYISPSVEWVLGHRPEDLVDNQGDGFNLVHPDDIGRLQSAVADSLNQPGTSVTNEMRLRHADGSWRHMESVLTNALDDQLVGGIIVNSRDVTERKRAQEALHESNRRLENILESITEDFFAVDREWRYTYINERALRRIQAVKGEMLRREDLLGKSTWEVFPEQVGSIFYQKYHEAIREQKTVHFEGYLSPTEEWYVCFAYPSEEGLAVYFRDITERKRSEEKLRQSEERFRAQYESFPAPTFSWRRVQEDFELVDYNEAADKITRGKLSGLLGMRASEWYADEPQILGMLSRCFGEGTTIQQEISWRLRTTGEHKYFTITFAYVPPDLVNHYAEDITERKQTEQALEESHTLLRSVIEGTPDVVFLKDAQGRYLVANSSAAKVLGKQVQELLGKDNTEFMPVEVARRITEVDRQVMDTQEPLVGEEHLSVEGISTTYLFTKAPYRDHRGDVAGVIGTARDITERKSAEEALRQTKERFHSLVQYSSDAITILGADGIVKYESPAVERVLGYRPEELVGKNGLDYIHPDDLERVSAVFAKVLDDPQVRPCVEYRFLHADGSWRYLEAISSNQLHNPSVEGVVINSRDVTERKRLEESQQRFLANAAHQLKTPITTIAGAAELLVTKHDLDVAKRRKLLDHIFNEGRHMQRLSDTLLRLARVGWDQRKPNLKLVDLTAAGRQAAERMMPLAESTSLALRVEGEGACALADPEWLQDVFLILLSNAIKYSKPGQKITLRLRDDHITVEDEGAGISSVDLPYVFERFYRGNGGVEGFGLGLSICQELVERMGGHITLSSREGVGTTVNVELPGTEEGA